MCVHRVLRPLRSAPLSALQGGAIRATDYVDLEISGSVFRDNVASSDGGAIFIVDKSNATLDHDVFDNNTAVRPPASRARVCCAWVLRP